MNLYNTHKSWGFVSVSLHWITAITVVAIFALGLWMVELTYYDSWYKKAPHIHKSVGILLFFLMLFRIIWRWKNTSPEALATHSRFELQVAPISHFIIYLFLFAIMLSGYLISTADGRGIDVFGWFEIPAILYGYAHQEDIAGTVHFYLATVLIVLVVLHAAAAIKHHYLDKDRTLLRMLGR